MSKVKICDRCKKIIDGFWHDNCIFSITYEGSKNFDWISGKVQPLDLCNECWDSWFTFTKKD